PSSGALALDTPTSGAIATGGELDNWTFFGRAGSSITVALDPGSGAGDGPITPYLNWAQVQLLGPGGTVLAAAGDTKPGAVLTLNDVMLPADGTYAIAVKAAASHPTSVGNYVVAAYDV